MDIKENTQEDLTLNMESKNEEEDNSNKNLCIDIATGYAAAESASISAQKAAIKYTKPDKYTGNRNLYDSGTARKDAKIESFKNNAEVLDPYTGDCLVLTKKEAKLLYGEEWTKHLAETDHIKPVKKIVEETQHNPWISVDDVQSIVDAPQNREIISRKTNNAKRDRTNRELVQDREYRASKGIEFTQEGERRALQDGQRAEVYTRGQEIIKTGKNILRTGHEAGMAGAKTAGITALTMSGIMNIVAVLKGEKDVEEAFVDTLENGGKGVATGYVIGDGLTTVCQSLTNSSSKFLQALSAANVPVKVLTAVTTVGDTLKRYGTGEITTQQCLLELGDKGLNLATTGYSMLVGQALIPIPIVGAAIGALVGSVMTSGLYQGLIGKLQRKELEHQERQRIIAECKQASEQLRAFRRELELYLESYFREYKDCFDEALSEIQFAYQIGDADGIIAGANQITRKLDGQVHYETVGQFKQFLDDKLIDVL